MSATINGSPRISETSVKQSGSSMHFWGVCCESGKQYAQVVGQRFRITMAVLDPKSFQNDSSEKVVSLIVLRGGIEYLLCILKHGEIHQVNLNLIFDKGENVKFYINGHGKVYLSGYQLTDSENDVVNDENGYLCPLVEVKSKSKKSKVDEVSASPVDTEPVASTSKQQNQKKVKKALWTSYITETIGEDEIESEEDDDFSVSDEESDDDEVSDEESDDDEISDEIEASELEDLTRDLSESDEEDSDVKIENATDSRKRRLQAKSPSQKRSRTDIQNVSTSMENGEEVICIEDNGFEVSSTSNFSVNSAGNTPMPKKHRDSEAPFGEKMSKKEKRLQEILRNLDHSQEKAKTSTPKPPKQAVGNSSKSGKHPLVKLEGGVEIQDIIVGRGPEATNGKLLHIFFVGRLPNNEVFDSRVPGTKPFSFRLGNKEVIKGWEVAIQGMRVGGRRKMKIPPQMAFGAAGNKHIPKGAVLRFVVDLQSVS